MPLARPRLPWQDRFTLGVPALDGQHREVLERAEAFLAAVEAHEGDAPAREAFGALWVCIRDHFASEERLMTESRYPGALAHFRAHQDLVKRIGGLREKLQTGGSAGLLMLKLHGVFATTISDHFVHCDGELAEWLRASAAIGPR